jgi:hypothetical protein
MRHNHFCRFFAISIAAFAIAGCGGGGSGGNAGTYSVGGTVSGLVGSGLTVEDPAAGSVVISKNGQFTLPNGLPSGTSYSVSITQEPSNPTQNCTLASGSGVVEGANAAGLSVTCGKPLFPIIVVLSGLLGSSLTVEDNVGDKLTLSANGEFSFPTPVASGGSYSVTIIAQPTTPPQSCAIQSASGTVGASSPSVTIVCMSTVLSSLQINFASENLGAVISDVSRNQIYVAAPNRNEVVVLDATSYLVLSHFFVGSSPLAMALSSDLTTLYVGLGQGGAVVLVNPDTQALTTVPVAAAMGTSFVNSLVELQPGVLLVGGAGAGTGTARSGYGNLITLNIKSGASQQVAAGFAIQSVNALVRSADGTRIYGLGLLYPTSEGQGTGGQQVLFSLDATSPTLPYLASTTVDELANIAVSQDGTKLVANTGAVFDASSLQQLKPSPEPGVGAVGETSNDSIIATALGADDFELLASNTLAPLQTYANDCPAGVGAISLTPAPAPGDWIIGMTTNILCVVSTSNPSVAPGAPGSRALPPVLPSATPAPWVEIPASAPNRVVIDSSRGVVYVADGAGTVDIYSLAKQTFVSSIPVPGKPQVVTLGADGTTLYVGLFDVGSVVTINRNTNAVTNGGVNLATALGTPDIVSITEIAPGHVLVSSIPSEGGIGPNTYLVDVVFANPSSAQRVGCAAGYQGALPVISPDGHYLYVVDAVTCPPEKRDLTQPGYPVVMSGPLGGYSGGDGPPSITPDGAHLLSGGVIIDTNTMQQTANFYGGLALASSNPDHYYLVDTQTVMIIELHDLKVLSFVQNQCQSEYFGVTDATISADEKTVIGIGPYDLGAGALCVTQITP